MKTEFYLPPEHEQKGIIANTPHWLREYFIKIGRELTLKDVQDKYNTLDDFDFIEWLEEEIKK